MRAVVIIVVAPCRNQLAGMAQVRKQVLVNADRKSRGGGGQKRQSKIVHVDLTVIKRLALEGYPEC